ncbi:MULTISPECIES: SseB family protein [unclassified Frankia]|uniref:SseB family protein n=1 Tax=unclassified Frankia TaxID=2632575 RepID=UPI002AD31864|nr:MULTISPECIES: SseB family protein [unclassified Frankia]
MKRELLAPSGQGDHGGADGALRAALDAGDEQSVATALVRARVFVAIEARRTDADPPGDPLGDPDVDPPGDAGTGAEKSSEMVLVTLWVPSGATAIPAFSGVDTLARWRRTARPVAVPGHALCAQAVRDGHSAVVLDIAGPAMATVDGELLERIAAL